MDEVAKVILAVSPSPYGVPRPLVGVDELKNVGVERKWITPDAESRYGFRRLDPPPTIDAATKKRLTPRELAIYYMLYRDKMRDELPQVAGVYDKGLSKYRDAARRGLRRKQKKFAKAQQAVMSAFMGYNPSKKVIDEMQGTMALMAEMVNAGGSGDDVKLCDIDDDIGANESDDDGQIEELQAAVANLQAKVQQDERDAREQEATKACEAAYYRGAMAGIESVLGDDVSEGHREKLVATVKKPDFQA